MSDFDKRFKERQEEFDREWERTKRTVRYLLILGYVLIGGVGAFIVWAIIKWMQFWGVI